MPGLDAVTIKNRYLFPLIGELLDRLNGVKVLSRISLKDTSLSEMESDIPNWK